MFLLNLPEEVHDEIFLRLPGKSILSCRCVCKLFYNLLSKPSFIKNHLNQTKNKNPKLVFKHRLMIYSVGIKSLPPSSSTASCEFDGVAVINYPFESNKSYSLDFLGSCNGLICLKINGYYIAEIKSRGVVRSYYYSILNPLTREYKQFRRLEKSYGGDVTHGFGYDSTIDDYKLVIISANGCFKIDIYTLRSDSWSSIQGNVNYKFRTGKGSHGVFFNGCLHWLGRMTTQKISTQVIVCFDISNETMVDIQLPQSTMPSKDYHGEIYANMGVWGDCICVAFIWGLVRIDVWVMQQYGVRESWIIKYTSTTIRLPSCRFSSPCWKPLWCFDNGEILVDYFCKELHLYDPTTEKVRPVVVRDITMDDNRESYVESIVSLHSGKYMEKQITDGIVKKLERQRLGYNI